MASLGNSQTPAITFENYETVINVLNRILELLYELDMPDKKQNSTKIKKKLKH